MSNSKMGLKGRLTQFDNTIKGKKGHGGSDRFLFEHPSYDMLVQKLFVSDAIFDCDVRSNMPKDLLVMGEVAKFEYVCFAAFKEEFKILPQLNNKESEINSRHLKRIL